MDVKLSGFLKPVGVLLKGFLFEFWETGVSASFGITVSNKAKFVA